MAHRRAAAYIRQGNSSPQNRGRTVGTLEELRRVLNERYEITRELGRGGMAIVYLARDVRHDRSVAIKVMRPEISAQSNFQRFEREIRVAARLQHPHILTVHDSGTAAGALYYVMPFVEGESLRDRLKREGALPVERALEIAREVADALDYAHRQGIIHRDIKPENILLTPGSGDTGGHAIVADFGIARAIAHEGEASATATGIAVGSPAYMSPEQAMGLRDLDARTDVYSLGCVVYEMLVGSPPFGLDSARVAMKGHVSGAPDPMGRRRASIPPGVQAAVERALAKNVDERFATAGEFRDALRQDVPTISMAASLAIRAVRPKVRIAVAAAAGALAVAATVFIVRPGSSATLKDRVSVLIADVDNATGDPIFRNSLVSALTAGIGQSERVTLVSRSRTNETLARMQRAPGDTVLDEKTAREAAVRESWGAVVLPSIAIFDSTYVITARIVDPATGSDLATETVRAAGKTAVIDALDALAKRVRRGLGESRLAVFRSSDPLPRVTTKSLDALEKYAAGQRAWDAGRMQEARELYAGALALDSNFALANVGMGRYLFWTNNDREGERYIARAMSSMGRITDRERMWAAAQIGAARGQWEQAATNYRAYLARYPGDATAWLNLGTTLMRDRRPREALESFAEFTRLDSTSGSAYINVATSYSLVQRYDSAVIFYKKAFVLRPEYETWFNLNHEYGFALVKGDRSPEARAVFQKMLQRPTPSDQARGHRSLGLLDLLEGRASAAIPHLTEAAAITTSLKERTSAARNYVFLAWANDLAGDAASARAAAGRAFDIFGTGYLDPGFSSRVAVVLARHGWGAESRQVLDSARARLGSGNNTDRAHTLYAAAELATARGVTDSARVWLQEAAVLDSSAEMLAPLADAIASAGDVKGAIATQQRLLANQTNIGYEAQFGWSLGRYRLGQLYERAGRQGAGAQGVRIVLSGWNGADQTLPAVVDARARLKRLLALRPPGETR